MPVHHHHNLNDNDILINVLLDRSGSMQGKETDTIGGFNSYINSQRNLPGQAYVSLVLFDDEYEEVYLSKRIQDVKPLNRDTYYTRGNTALLDAVGRLINSLEGQEIPKKVVFLITTDGLENASREYTKEKIKALIESHQKNYNWQFIFYGAGIDSFAESAKLGIPRDWTWTSGGSGQSISSSYNYLGSLTSDFRSGVSATMDTTIGTSEYEPPVIANNADPILRKRKKKEANGTTDTTGI